MAGVDFGYFLNRKYSILQDEANATTRNAASNAQNANANTRNAATGALTGAAQAQLDRTRNALLPGESAAQIANLGAETRSINENTRFIAPLANSTIRGNDASARNLNAQSTLSEQDAQPGSSVFGSSLGALGVPRPTLGAGPIVAGRFRVPRAQDRDAYGNLTAAGLDYINP